MPSNEVAYSQVQESNFGIAFLASSFELKTNPTVLGCTLFPLNQLPTVVIKEGNFPWETLKALAQRLTIFSVNGREIAAVPILLINHVL